MAKSFRELWKISGVVYREVCFQSIFSLRLGATLPKMDSYKIGKMTKQAEMNLMVNKILITVFVVVLSILPLGYWSFFVAGLKLPEEIAVVGCVSVFLSSLFFLLVMLGLQATTSFIATNAFEILGNLPISRGDVSKIALLSFLRIFDIPLIVVLIVFPVTFSIVVGSPAGGLASLFAIGLTEIFALTLTIGLAKLFYSKIVSGGGSSKYRTIMRFIYMFIWILPSFGIYLVMNFATQILQTFVYSLAQISSVHAYLLALIYPFSLGFMVSSATFPQTVGTLLAAILLSSTTLYAALAYLGLNYIGSTIKRICSGAIVTASKVIVGNVSIRPKSAWLGVIVKDLRVASRSPSYASILMLPALQTIIMVVSLLGIGNINLPTIVGFLAGVSLLSLIATPTLFSAETLASSYMKSIPLKRRTIVIAKTSLSTLTYLGCVIALTAVTAYIRQSLILVVAFGFIQMLSVAAGCMMELLLLIRKFWDEELTYGNIYANLSTFIIVLIPGIILCLLPTVACFIIGFANIQLALTVFLLSAITEFVAIASFIHILVKN